MATHKLNKEQAKALMNQARARGIESFEDMAISQIQNETRLNSSNKIKAEQHPGASRLITPLMPDDGMNKTEKAFSRLLNEAIRQGLIESWIFQGMYFRMAKNTFHHPDFSPVIVLEPFRHIAIFEVKGHWEDDARVKWKTVAAMHPWSQWYAVQKIREKEDGGWLVERYGDCNKTRLHEMDLKNWFTKMGNLIK